jgi:hypothetical protein
MERTYGLVCTLVSFIALVIVVGIFVSLMGQQILANPGVSQLMHVLGG